MYNFDYGKLQNGSDIRGVALSGVEDEIVNLNKESVSQIAKGFLCWLKGELGKKPKEIRIAIGRDSRLSGENLVDTFTSALLPYNVTVINCGLASTPAMFMSTIFDEIRADGAIMTTASHLPWNRNGFKFFTKSGGLNKDDITDILNFAESNNTINMLIPLPSKKSEHKIENIDLMARYSSHLRDLILKEIKEEHPSGILDYSNPLSNMKICVDAGNGAGGFYATEVLEPLGADISSSQFLEPDGNFPNHAPNPENPKAMESISSQVKKSKCDLGIIFDTDVDRSSAVDEKGNEINRNGIVAMAAALIAKKYPETTVVTDSVTSDQLNEYLEKVLNLHHFRFKRGYRNVINKAIELNKSGIDAQLAIETSGHAAYKDNYFLDDGAFLATKIVIKSAILKSQGKGISSVISELKEPLESEEIRLPITSDNFALVADSALLKIKELPDLNISENLNFTLVEPNYEGVRIAFSGKYNGWFLLRKSLHDPIMPMNIEALENGGCKAVRNIIRKLLSPITGIDLSKL